MDRSTNIVVVVQSIERVYEYLLEVRVCTNNHFARTETYTRTYTIDLSVSRDAIRSCVQVVQQSTAGIK
jgi:hypothetical protein